MNVHFFGKICFVYQFSSSSVWCEWDFVFTKYFQLKQRCKKNETKTTCQKAKKKERSKKCDMNTDNEKWIITNWMKPVKWLFDAWQIQKFGRLLHGCKCFSASSLTAFARATNRFGERCNNGNNIQHNTSTGNCSDTFNLRQITTILAISLAGTVREICLFFNWRISSRNIHT